jgi:hypothetical protein
MENLVSVFEDEMDTYLDGVEKSFDLTVGTWKRKPKFKREVSSTELVITGEYSTEDQVMRWISGGTRVRYATMSKGFQAKTRPGKLRSGAGRGGVAYVSRLKPRPGIKARKFGELVEERNKPKLIAGWKRAVKALAQLIGAP